MPQFDLVVYSNEIVWVFVFFLTLYSLNYLFFFPRMAEVLKARSKKVELDLILLNKLNEKTDKFFLTKENYFYNTILLLSFNDYLNFSTCISFLEKTSVLGYNLYIRYYLNNFYKYFDFYELEQF